jgi:Calcineurin-like phosphoesterase
MLTIKLPNPRINFTFISDIHLSATPVGSRGDDYMEAIFSKLEFTRATTTKIGGVCLVGGDVFHHKNPKSPANKLSMIERLIRVFGSYPLDTVFGTPGNHDLTADSMDSIPSQPLGILMAAGVYRDLSSEPILFINETGTVKIQVESFPYADETTTLTNILNAPPRNPEAQYRVGIVHAYGNPGGAGSLYGTRTIGYDELVTADFDFLLWGHDHSAIETQTVGNVTHVRLGSLARAAIDYDSQDRAVQIQILSFAEEGIRMPVVRIPVQPFDAVFVTADKAVKQVPKLEEISDFFTQMNETVNTVETTDPRSVIRNLCSDDPSLMTLVFELCNL